MRTKGLAISQENLEEYEKLKSFVEEKRMKLFEFMKQSDPTEHDLLTTFYQPSYEAFNHYN